MLLALIGVVVMATVCGGKTSQQENLEQTRGALETTWQMIGAHWRARAEGELALAVAMREVLAQTQMRLATEEAMEVSEQRTRGYGDLVDRRVRRDGSPAQGMGTGLQAANDPNGHPPDLESPILLRPPLEMTVAAGCLDSAWRLAADAAVTVGLPDIPIGDNGAQSARAAASWEYHSQHMQRPLTLPIQARPGRLQRLGKAGVLACRIAGLGVPATLGDLLSSPVSHAYTLKGAESDAKGPSDQSRGGANKAESGRNSKLSASDKEQRRRLDQAMEMSQGRGQWKSEAAPVAMGQRPAGDMPAEWERRRQGLLGPILNGKKGIDWELLRTRVAQVVAGPPVIVVRVGLGIVGAGFNGLVSVIDALGLPELLLQTWANTMQDGPVMLLPRVHVMRSVPFGGSQWIQEQMTVLSSRANRGAAARDDLLSRVELAAAMSLGSEAQQGLAWTRKAWSRYVSKPVRWAATASGIAWVLQTGWGVGDALWSLLDQPLDKRYRRPEAELLRQTANWLEYRQKRHNTAAIRAALLATLASGGRISQGHASLVTEAVPLIQPPSDRKPAQDDTADFSEWLLKQVWQIWTLLDWNSLMGLYRPRKPVPGDTVEVVTAAYATLEASRMAKVAAPCGWTNSAMAGARVLRTGCGVSQRALLPILLLDQEPGGLAARLLGSTSLSRPQQLAADSYKQFHQAITASTLSAAAPRTDLRVVDWDGRGAASSWTDQWLACGMDQRGEGYTLTMAQSEKCALFLQGVAMRPDTESHEYWWEAGALAPWPFMSPQQNTTTTESTSTQQNQVSDPTHISWKRPNRDDRGIWLTCGSTTQQPLAHLLEWLPSKNTTLARFAAIDTTALPKSCRGSGSTSLTGWEAHVQFDCGPGSNELSPHASASITPRGVCILSFKTTSVIAC